MRNPLFALTGSVALITGATHGIGLAIAREYGRAGASLVISGATLDDVQRAAADLQGEGIEVRSLVADLSRRDQVDRLASACLEMFGRIDVLVCNADLVVHVGALASASEAQWRLTMRGNLESAVWLTNALLPTMSEQRGGSVILIADVAGIRGSKRRGLYGLSKAALTQLARNLAVEWGPSNIRVNTISPGMIQAVSTCQPVDVLPVVPRRPSLPPLRRAGRPEEVAALALLLAAPGGAFISGQNLIVDGGATIGGDI